MTQFSEGAAGAGPSHRAVDIGVAVSTAIFAIIIIVGSLRAGIDWGAEGPKAGFLPFYIGLFILGASVVNFINALDLPGGKLFAEWSQLRQVLSVVVPTAIYVAIIPSIGIYLSSALLIGVFMRWFGRYAWTTVFGVSIGVSVIVFLVFEKWFLVPLPKGIIEELLGL
jgi:hypothetical protein